MRIIPIIFCTLSFATFAQMEISWSFLHPLKKEWIELGEKGSVQEALIATGELPDPFYGTNEEKFGWIEEYEWQFKSIFFIEELTENHYELEFPSIDTYAKIYLNGSLILETDNAFIPHSKQVKDHLKTGMNELEIIFTPPVIYHKDTKSKVGYQLPAPNDVHETAIAPYVRKPQYQFGWDWSLRMNTIGLNKPVKLHSYELARVVNRTTRIISVEDNRAVIEFDIYLSNCELEEIKWDTGLFGEESVKGKNGVFTRRVEVSKPQLWWPRGQGEQYLYEDVFYVFDAEGAVQIDVLPVKFGIKQSELIQEKDEWGTSYYFKINGRRVFGKGADYIPQEIFPAKVKDENIIRMVEDMAESNFNMVRVWGGGYYPDEVFFEKCDELGIMVWQDLMFACAMYPGDDAFLSNISKEFEYQVPRIAAHPSVVLFNGNNEVEVAWENWGFQIKYGLFGKSARAIEKAYDDIFKKIAPRIIKKHSTVPYIHTSPLSNWGKMELYNHGSQHYWGVWHGKDPIEDFGKKIGRFNAEYGFQSFPEYNTLHSFSEESDWDLSSDVMKHHQKSYVGNDMILKHAKRLYGVPENFEDFVYYSQLTQSVAVSMAVAGHRIDAPRCGGTLYWQLNDCWPAPSWSSIDYFGNWKALQYRIRDDYQDVTVLEKYEDLKQKEYYFVSDAPDTLNYNVTCSIYNLSGELIAGKEFSHDLGGEESVLLDISDLEDLVGVKNNFLIIFKFKDNRGKHSSRIFEHLPSTYDKAIKEDISISFQRIDPETKTATIKIETNKFLRNLWLSSSKFGVRFDKNFESFLPGSHYITIQYEEEPNVEDFKMMWM